MNNIHWIDVEELAKLLLNLDENADSDDVGNALYEQYEIDFDNFEKIVVGLVKFTPVVETAILKTKMQGFVYDGALIVSQEVE